MLARFLAKGNPLAEVADLKGRLQAAEDALRLEEEKFTKLLQEHEALQKATSDHEAEYQRGVAKLRHEIATVLT